MNENNQPPFDNQQTTNTTTENMQTSNQAPVAVQPQPEKKNNSGALIVIIIILALAVVGLLVKFVFTGDKDTGEGDKSTPPTEEVKNGGNGTDTTDSTETPATPPTSDSTSISQAVVNGVTISFPCTKDAFNGTGWTWDEKYAKTDLAANYTTSGGRIGQYPGGVVVSVINDTTETKHIEDCTIDDGTFYNPGDGSKTTTFVGGIDFSYSIDSVKEKMTSLGYKNVKESTIDKSVNLSYFLNDDQNNYKDQIIFNFYDNTLKSVEIRTAG